MPNTTPIDLRINLYPMFVTTDQSHQPCMLNGGNLIMLITCCSMVPIRAQTMDDDVSCFPRLFKVDALPLSSATSGIHMIFP